MHQASKYIGGPLIRNDMLTLFEQYDLLSRSGLFDAEYYLEENAEVQAANIDPLLHYIETGARDGRRPSREFDVDFYLGQCGSLRELADNPLLHFLLRGAARGLRPHPSGATGQAIPEP